MKKTAISKLIMALSLSLGMLVGTSLPAAAFEKENTLAKFPVNEYGQTYGSCANTGSWENAPELVAVGQDVNGYCRREDLFADQINFPKSPDDKAGWEKWDKLYGSGNKDGYEIPVYKVDGRTVIGTFTVGGSSDEPDGDVSKLSFDEALGTILKAEDARK